MEPGRILYFYEELCASCQEGNRFLEFLYQQTGDLNDGENHTVKCVNTFRDGTEAYQAVCDELELPPEDRRLPLLVINDGYLSGADAIEAQTRLLFCDAFSLPDPLTLRYYYRPGCGDCAKIEAFTEALFQAHPQYRVVKIDTTEPGPKEAFQASLKRWGVPTEEWQVPFLCRDGRYLSGSQAIQDQGEAFLDEE